MSLVAELLILFAAALLCSACGFKKYVYFISLGYGFSISGLAVAMFILHGSNATAVISCVILFLYGLRLGGYLLYREAKSNSYQKHMKNEIKDGASMKLFVKVMLWVFCALLYAAMVSPVFFRLYNGAVKVDIWFIIGTVLMVSGIALESAADLTKQRAKRKDPKRFCDRGLFRLVRCPNYLGELILWTGVLVNGIAHLNGVLQWTLALLGYLGIVFVMFSGARRLEVRQNRNYGGDPEYRQYVKTVPILLPFVPLYSVEKYKFLVL